MTSTPKKSLKQKLFAIWEWVSLGWCCGGGLAVSLLMLAVFAVWIISLIAAVFWMVTSK